MRNGAKIASVQEIYPYRYPMVVVSGGYACKWTKQDAYLKWSAFRFWLVHTKGGGSDGIDELMG